jgi:hypothetical protein
MKIFFGLVPGIVHLMENAQCPPTKLERATDCMQPTTRHAESDPSEECWHLSACSWAIAFSGIRSRKSLGLNPRHRSNQHADSRMQTKKGTTKVARRNPLNRICEPPCQRHHHACNSARTGNGPISKRCSTRQDSNQSVCANRISVIEAPS